MSKSHDNPYLVHDEHELFVKLLCEGISKNS